MGIGDGREEIRTMSKFPDRIPLPFVVKQSREQRKKHMLSTARTGVLFRSLIIAAELVGYAYFQSSSLLLDALSSIIDIGASLFLMLCIKLADKPPDRHHPFGHGRFEPVAGLQLGIFLAVIGGWMFVQQLTATFSESNRIMNAYTWLIPLGAVVLLEIGYRRLRYAAKKQNSPALLADAVHYRIDSINSLFATVALLLASYFPLHSLLFDHIGALLIACLMIIIGAVAARGNLDQILDRAPEPVYFQRVHEAALKVHGVLATEKLRIQSYGPDAHVSIDIEVEPGLSVEEAHKITQRVRAEIQTAWPAVRDVIVHVEPYYAGDHHPIPWS
jgi:cation diffusion facilitator family transporter